MLSQDVITKAKYLARAASPDVPLVDGWPDTLESVAWAPVTGPQLDALRGVTGEAAPDSRFAVFIMRGEFPEMKPPPPTAGQPSVDHTNRYLLVAVDLQTLGYKEIMRSPKPIDVPADWVVTPIDLGS